MPLPAGEKIQWPPKSVAPALPLFEEWGAWYSGDPKSLAKVYGNFFSSQALVDPKVNIRPASIYQGGIIGIIPRKFWGSPPPGGNLTSARMHVPLAGDIAATSADLLFGEEIKIRALEDAPDVSEPDPNDPDLSEHPIGAQAADPKLQARIDAIMNEGGVMPTLLEAAEMAAAYGGVYLRAGWDKDICDHPLVDAIPPDAAVPEWRSGRLKAVTFWRELSHDGGTVWRHLELHEVLKGQGVIWHGLYKGTNDELGQLVELTDHPDTHAFADLVGESGYVETGAKRLAVVYVPNMRPQKHPSMRGSLLGRSDYAGIESIMDALDESWSSWMRDIRLGKGRVIAPDSYLTSRGRGKGSYFDTEREVFETVAALSSADGGLNLQIVQFAIRVKEHQDTCQALLEQAVRAAGYSAATFGSQGDIAQTATEVTNRKERSTVTRSRKIRYWTPQLRSLFVALLEIDVKQFGSKITPKPPMIEFPDAAGVDPQAQAQVLQMLRAAEVISLRSAVAQLNPDWEEGQVVEEIKRIMAEAQLQQGGDTAPPGASQDPNAGGDAGGGQDAGADPYAGLSIYDNNAGGNTQQAPSAG